MSQYLHGLHDVGGEHLHADKPGWTVITEAIGSDANDKSGRDYRYLSNRGFTVIARLNNGYYPAGSIPAPSAYGAFAQRCANFVKASHGCAIFIIANELNHLQEQIPDQPVTPQMYADCFNRCYAAIKAVDPNAQVVTAPVAPWDASTKYHGNESGDWVVYFRDKLEAIASCDGIGLHAYSHGAGVNLITSSARMGSPFQHRRYEFRAYLDFLEAVPSYWESLPVYITEMDQVDPWVDSNTGWVQAAYAEIHGHNQTPGTQKILCAAMYRWDGDKWALKNKTGVHADFRAAVAKGYKSPSRGAKQVQTSPAEPSLSFRTIDPRATAREVTIETPSGSVLTWRVTEIHWLDEKQSQGRHHIYVDVLDEQGKRLVNVPLLVAWPTGWTVVTTEAKPGEPWSANFPMSPSRNEFSVKVDGLALSETVKGIGMGADTPGGFNAGVHTSTAVVFQRVTAATPPALPPIPQPPEPTTVHIPAIGTGALPTTVWVRVNAANLRGGPGTEFAILEEMPQGTSLTVTGSTSTRDWYQVRKGNLSGWTLASLLNAQPVVTPAPEPQAADDNWSRAWPIVLKFEGGLSLDPNDSGNYFDGKLIGTKFGISAASWGGQYDIPNLTQVQVLDIYKRHYWEAAGCESIPWPMCLIHFDTAINHGVSVAILLKARQPTPEEIYLGLRALRYFQDPKWRNFGVAWGLRVGHLDDIAKGKVNA